MGKNSKKHTLEFVKEQYKKKRNFEFLDEEYINSDFKHNIKCLKCGNIWQQRYQKLRSGGGGCPACIGNIKYTLEFIREEYRKNNLEFLDLSYNGNMFKHNIKCLKCGHIWQQRYTGLKHGHGCPICAKEKIRQTCLQKYGVDSPNKFPAIALKQARKVNRPSIKKHWQTNAKLICQGSYEAKTVDYLNANRINYKWQPKTFMLSTGQTYRPDLYLIDQDLWVEIKGWMRPDGLLKWTEFHDFIQPNSVLWDKSALKELTIL